MPSQNNTFLVWLNFSLFLQNLIMVGFCSLDRSATGTENSPLHNFNKISHSSSFTGWINWLQLMQTNSSPTNINKLYTVIIFRILKIEISCSFSCIIMYPNHKSTDKSNHFLNVQYWLFILFDSVISRSILHEVCSIVFHVNKNLLPYFISFSFRKNIDASIQYKYHLRRNTWHGV